jgi:hypothetical protein
MKIASLNQVSLTNQNYQVSFKKMKERKTDRQKERKGDKKKTD